MVTDTTEGIGGKVTSWRVLLAATALQLVGAVGFIGYLLVTVDELGFAGIAGFLLVGASVGAFVVSLPVAYALANDLLKPAVSFLLVLFGIVLLVRAVSLPLLLPVFGVLILGTVFSGLLGLWESGVIGDKD